MSQNELLLCPEDASGTLPRVNGSELQLPESAAGKTCFYLKRPGGLAGKTVDVEILEGQRPLLTDRESPRSVQRTLHTVPNADAVERSLRNDGNAGATAAVGDSILEGQLSDGSWEGALRYGATLSATRALHPVALA